MINKKQEKFESSFSHHPIKIRHIINPVLVSPSSDLYIAQPITFASLEMAQQNAAKHGLQVDVCFTCYDEDNGVIPSTFRNAGKLNRSILDIGNFRKPRKLPLIQDIINKALLGEPVDYIVYTNVDIAVQPNFYIEITRFIELGYDAFTINRRTISKSYTSLAELPLMYAETGVKHPGHDCFIFSQKASKQYRLGSGCIGANWIGRILLSNLMAFSRKFKTFEEEILTFHIGDDRSWKKEEFNDYDIHNERELIKTLQYLQTICKSSTSADIKQMLDFHINNQIAYDRVEQNRVHRQYKTDISFLLGRQYKGSTSWKKPITLNQAPIFVVGYPRSGTTLLQSKLMTQNGIVSLPETHFFSIVRNKLRVIDDKIRPDCLKDAFFTLRERLPFSVEAEQYLTQLAENSQLSPKMMFEAIVVDNLVDNYSLSEIQRSRFLEKTPDHVERLEIIFRNYPDAKVVNIVRHPEKAILSRRANFPGEDTWDIAQHIQKWKTSSRRAQ
ncbi:sulfotransferase [Methylobacter sp. BBA5.1]|uniref:sulfotransferase family protein n=1 Tax=Methylobacter sp. BBA5.1 TaxID=1495064 RepID=UPI0013766BB5|nr:sulfotransferase [Methylobacter sp. BBA5.1]